MGDIQDGTARILPEGENIVLQALPGEGVQGGKGLVHHENGGVHCQHPGDGGPLFHAAGELPGIALFKALQAHAFHQGPGGFLPLGFGDAPQLHRQQGVRLGDIPYRRKNALDGFSRQTDLAAGGDNLPCQDIQSGGFPTAGGAHQSHQFPLRHGQIDLIQCQQSGTAVGKRKGHGYLF